MGSEMCIRDRNVYDIVIGTPEHKFGQDTDPKHSLNHCHNGICLLYTSDAADDSLRVDLGGRRIIKKKFFQAEDGIRDRSPSRGLGDVYKRQFICRG